MVLYRHMNKLEKYQRSFLLHFCSAILVVVIFYIGVFYVNKMAYAADYTGSYGTGDRQSIITATTNGGYSGAVNFVDGDQGDSNIFASGAVSGNYIRFQLTTGADVFTEAIFYQNGTHSHGTHKWQGSNNASDWTDIGSSFTLGGETTQTQTQLSGNVTEYEYYQLIGVSGSFNVTPWLHEFEFGSPANAAPTVSITSAVQESDVPVGTGKVDIVAEVNDADGDDTVKLKMEYKLGTTCSSGTSDPTLDETDGSTTADTADPKVENDDTYQVGNSSGWIETSSGSNTVNFDWLSDTDVPSADATYCIKITPNDGNEDGTAVTTTLTLDNVDPTAAGNLTLNTLTTTTLTFDYGVAGSDTNMEGYETYYKAGASGVTTEDTGIEEILTASYDPDSTVQVTSLSVNTQYVTNIWTTDLYANTVSSTEIAKYTAANAAGTPTVNASSTTALTVIIDNNSNPDATTFFILETGSGNYVQMDATLGASPIEGTYTEFGEGAGIDVVGLSANTQYTFAVISRNGDSVNAATSTGASKYTLASVPSSVAITGDSAVQATVSWTGDATNYYVENVTAGTNSGWTSDSSVAFAGLNCTVTYTFRVKGRNGEGVETAWASSVIGNTLGCADDSSANSGIYIDTSPPYNLSVHINNDEDTTSDAEVHIALSAKDANEMIVSDKSDFDGASWEGYISSKTWIFDSAFSTKTIYVKFRDVNNNTSEVVSDEISLVPSEVGVGEDVLGEKTEVEETEEIEAETIIEEDTTIEKIECPLEKNIAYKSPDKTAVYYVTEAHNIDGTIDESIPCTRRAFVNAHTYFTYYTTWDNVIITEQTILDSIPKDVLGFMPYGPLYDPQYGALVKTIQDTKVYLLLGTEKYWITSEIVYEALNYAWDWIEDVAEDLLHTYTEGTEIVDTTTHPDYTLIKYADSPKVYKLEDQKKRWIKNPEVFEKSVYRWDRIVVIQDDELYEDGEILE